MEEKKKGQKQFWYANIRCPKCNRRFMYDGIKFYCECGFEIKTDKELDKIKNM